MNNNTETCWEVYRMDIAYRFNTESEAVAYARSVLDGKGWRVRKVEITHTEVHLPVEVSGYVALYDSAEFGWAPTSWALILPTVAEVENQIRAANTSGARVFQVTAKEVHAAAS
jgi:hypothetical protein